MDTTNEPVRWECRCFRTKWMEWRPCTRKDHDEIQSGQWTDRRSGGRKYEARALYTAQQPSVAVTEAVEYRMWDSQWINVVNHANAYDGWSIEDAVSHAVRMTEQAMAKNTTDGKWPSAREITQGAANER